MTIMRMIYLLAGICVIGIALYVFRKYFKKGTISTADDDQSISSFPWLYPVGLIVTFSAWGIVGAFLHFEGIRVTLGEYILDFGYLMGVFALLHLVADIQKIPLDKIGGVFFFGIPTAQFSGIWIPVPPLLFSLTTVSKLVIEIEIPTDPEKVWREDGPVPADLVAQGFKPPFRVPFADPPNPKTAPPDLIELALGIDPNDPLHRRSTNEVTWFARLQIDEIFNFLGNIGSETEAKRNIEDVGSSLINDKLAQMTPSMALRALDRVSVELQDVIRDHTRSWGVRVRTARIKQIEFSHRLNGSVQLITVEAAGAIAAAKRAEGEKQKRILEGQGDAEALKARREGSGLSASEVLAAQTGVEIATVLANGTGAGKTVILGASGAISDVLGVIQAANSNK